MNIVIYLVIGFILVGWVSVISWLVWSMYQHRKEEREEQVKYTSLKDV